MNRRIVRTLAALVSAPLAAFALLAASFPEPPASKLATTHASQTAVLAGGCFWGLEAVFENLHGVTSVVSGYSGGDAKTAEYETVGSGQTGHAESVKITFDPAQISYGQLLKVYFAVAHDPTELNRQGPDSGTQYRSTIFFAGGEQQRIANAYIKQLDDAKVFPNRIVTTVVPLRAFYAAEAYHQHFFDQHPNYPYIVINDKPKVEALRAKFPDLLKRRAS